SRLRWNIAIRSSSNARRFARSSSNATCSGQSSMQFIMPMPKIRDSVQPRLARGVRLETDSATGKSVLLFPEGIVELNETAHGILTLCDGRTVSEIDRKSVV